MRVIALPLQLKLAYGTRIGLGRHSDCARQKGPRTHPGSDRERAHDERTIR